MEAEQTLQSIRDDFALTARNNFKPSLANDMTDISYLIQNAQNALTLAAQGHEENNDTEKVSVSILRFSKKRTDAYTLTKVNELDETFKEFVTLEHKLSLQKKALDTVKQRINAGEKIVSFSGCV